MKLLLNSIKNTGNILTQFIYPKICHACDGVLYTHEHIFCTKCRVNFPRTNFHWFPEDNPVTKTFWGKTIIRYGFAYLLFSKDSKTQTSLHHLKYHNKKEVAFEFGKIYGSELKESNLLNDVDYIFPVPLHKDKLLKRGFNQSLLFADGLSSVLNIPATDQFLLKTLANETQTKKNRIERWDNTKDVYTILNPEILKNKKILLVDDVITTGATIESCVKSLLISGVCSVDVASIAYTGRI